MLRITLIIIALVNLVASAASSRESSVIDGEASLRALQDSFFTDQDDADLNGDGIVDYLDLGLLKSLVPTADPLMTDMVHVPLGVETGGNVLFFTLPGQFTPISQVSATEQESLFLDLHMSFADTTVGGGLDLIFDSGVLSFIDGIFDDGLGDDPNFRCPTDLAAPNPVDCAPNGPNFVSFGSFLGITGDHLVVSLEFLATATGSSPIGFTVTSPFSDTSGDPLEVPEPSAAWLAAAALATLGALNVRRRRTPG